MMPGLGDHDERNRQEGHIAAFKQSNLSGMPTQSSTHWFITAFYIGSGAVRRARLRHRSLHRPS